ncbi:GAF and ANTAR domain-containing protein [Pseudonocardia pini]|uniref:GAF and ANTAR domain-containing protein n=1 Tax=Pseudonocardia pini TaxID=2758030 RepID=UPI0015F011F7|nr:GAF and ANTAR domain-containing protein [Pseudonocardia pini]
MRAFARLAHTPLDAGRIDEILDRVAAAALDVVTGADIVSVSLRRGDGVLDTLTTTDPIGVRLDELQNQFDEGPCLDADRVTDTRIAVSRDLAAGREFPKWGPAAAELGVGSALAIALSSPQSPPRIGSLTIYSRRPGGLDRVDRDTALILAAHASTAVAGTLAASRSELQVTRLKEALRSRDVIGQAKGILMERRGVDETEAFTILRAASQSLDINLGHVAETLASRRDEL